MQQFPNDDARPAPGWRDAPPAIPARQRLDGWTPDRQRAFLEYLADGLTVETACRGVGLTHQSAYALRKRACGAGFAAGWDAACLHARTRLADVAYSRAMDGYTETTTRPDGSVVARHKYDNRLLSATLTRLDRLADAASGEGGAVTRHIAANFDRFCDMIEFGRPMDIAAFAACAVRDPLPPEFAPSRACARPSSTCARTRSRTISTTTTRTARTRTRRRTARARRMPSIPPISSSPIVRAGPRSNGRAGWRRASSRSAPRATR